MKTRLAILFATIFVVSLQAQVLSSNAVVYGNSIGQWSAEWWKWIFAVPTNQNPGFDPDGSQANIGQSGPVFFLAGVLSFSGTTTRSFTVPEGKYIFFPILNVYADNIGNVPPWSIDKLRDLARGYIDSTTNLHTIIDGIAVANLFDHRAESPAFSFDFLTTDNLVSIFLGHPFSGLDDPIVSDGYWLMLKPLSVGTHTVEFGGTIGPPYNFTIRLIDTVTVIPVPLPQRVRDLISSVQASGLAQNRQRMLLANLRLAEKRFATDHPRNGILQLRLFQSKVRLTLKRDPALRDQLVQAAQSIINRARDGLDP